MPDRVVALAPAKLNLALSVGPPDADRMHPIASWMVTVDLHDELDLRRLPAGSLSRYAVEWHPDARRQRDIDWSISKDLAVRAHLATERLVGRSLPVQLRLRKRIPVGGGLGGGSSDAAAMIVALDRLHGLGLDERARHALATGLGSDVAFLLDGGSAIVEGRGERLDPLPSMPRFHAVLAFPAEGCPTAAVYRRFDELPGARLDPERVRSLAEVEGGLDPHAPFNDLAEPACLEQPALRGIRRDLAEVAGRPAHVSGSGSTLFVLCDDAVHARRLAAEAERALDLPMVAVAAAARPAPVAH